MLINKNGWKCTEIGKRILKAYKLMTKEIYAEKLLANVDPPQVIQIVQKESELYLKVKHDDELQGMGDFYKEFRLVGSKGTITAG